MILALTAKISFPAIFHDSLLRQNVTLADTVPETFEGAKRWPVTSYDRSRDATINSKAFKLLLLLYQL